MNIYVVVRCQALTPCGRGRAGQICCCCFASVDPAASGKTCWPHETVGDTVGGMYHLQEAIVTSAMHAAATAAAAAAAVF